jgi:hypothetical protein
MIYVTHKSHAATSELCRVESQVSQQADNLPISLSSESAIAGAPAVLKWTAETSSIRGDQYLVVNFPDAVRFRGTGFAAFTAGARAPRSIKFGADRVRLIAALSGELKNPVGEAGVIYYQSGPSEIEWAVVNVAPDGGGKCIETVLKIGAIALQVGLGRPELVSLNRFDQFKGEKRFRSPNGKDILYTEAGRFQLRNGAGDLVLERAGTEPSFSETGRFLSFLNSAGRLEITDTITNSAVYVTSDDEQGEYGGANILLWSDHDSVAIGAYARKGAFAVIMPLVEDRRSFSGWLNCNACQAYDGSSIVVDVDRMAFRIVGPQADDGKPYYLSLLEVADSPTTIADWNLLDAEARSLPGQPIQPRFKVAPFRPTGLTADKIELHKDKQQQDELLWASTDGLFVSRAELWADGSNNAAKNKLLLTRQKRMQAEPDIDGSTPPLGRIVRRSLAVGDKQVTPQSLSEKLESSLKQFNVTLATTDSGSVFKLAKNFNDKNDARAVKLLQSVVLSASDKRLTLLPRLDKKRWAEGSLVRSYSGGLECISDEDVVPGDVKPVVISADRLVSLWKFQTATQTLVVTQQMEECGTAPVVLSEMILIIQPNDRKLRPVFYRLASSNTTAGGITDPPTVGDRMRLTDWPELIVSLSGGRYLTVASRGTGTAVIFDMDANKVAGEVNGMPEPLDIASLRLTEDNKFLLQTNRNGALYFYSIATGKPELFGRVVDDEIVLFDPTLHYESTPEGADYVFLRVPGTNDLYSLDQFEARLKRPGVARERLGGSRTEQAAPLGLTPPALRAEMVQDKIRLQAWSSSPLVSARVKIDGVSQPDIPLSGSSAAIELPAKNFENARWVNFYVENSDGLRSAFRSFHFSAKPYAGALRTVVIGIDHYKKAAWLDGVPVPDLQFAATDAIRFDEAVSSLVAPHYAQATSTRVVSEDAVTETHILSAIRSAAAATGPKDTLLLFVASHGYVGASEFSLAVPPEQPGDKVSLLPFVKVTDALRLAKGRIVIFIDACHSAGATHDAALQELIKANENVVVVAASKGSQSSYEGPTWKGGAFTSQIVARFDEAAKAPTPLSIEELYARIRSGVANATDGRQTPWLSRASWQGAQSLN